MQLRQRDRIDGENRVEVHLALQSGLLILLDEGAAGLARVKHEYSFCTRRLCLGQFGGKIKLCIGTPFRHVLTQNLPLEGGFDTAHHVLAGGIVRRHDVDRLDAFLVKVLTHRHRCLIVLPGRRKEVLVTTLSRHLRRTGIGADQELVRVEYRLGRGQQHVRPDVTGDEIDIVLLDQLVGFLLADIGLETVVFHDQLDVEIAHLAADVFHRQLDRVFHVFTDDGGRRRQGGHETDLDAFSLRGARHANRARNYGCSN